MRKHVRRHILFSLRWNFFSLMLLKVFVKSRILLDFLKRGRKDETVFAKKEKKEQKKKEKKKDEKLKERKRGKKKERKTAKSST